MFVVHARCWIDGQHLADGKFEFLFEVLGAFVLKTLVLLIAQEPPRPRSNKQLIKSPAV